MASTDVRRLGAEVAESKTSYFVSNCRLSEGYILNNSIQSNPQNENPPPSHFVQTCNPS